MSPIAHFAINADDVPATRRFYEATFGWTFRAWGPPTFFHVMDGDEVVGALQGRRDLAGHRVSGFECTVAIDDVDATVAAAEAAGGRVLLPKTVIAGVGELTFLSDPSGNVVGAMRYDASAE